MDVNYLFKLLYLYLEGCGNENIFISIEENLIIARRLLYYKVIYKKDKDFIVVNDWYNDINKINNFNDLENNIKYFFKDCFVLPLDLFIKCKLL